MTTGVADVGEAFKLASPAELPGEAFTFHFSLVAVRSAILYNRTHLLFLHHDLLLTMSWTTAGPYVKLVWISILASYLLFGGMFFAMDGMGLYGSEFFHFQSDDDATPAMILGVALKTKGQYWGVIAFFFFNSFFSVWNGIVIAPIFEGMVYDDNYDLEDWGGGSSRGKPSCFCTKFGEEDARSFPS